MFRITIIYDLEFWAVSDLNRVWNPIRKIMVEPPLLRGSSSTRFGELQNSQYQGVRNKKPPLKVQKFRQICGSTIFRQIWPKFSGASIFGQIWPKFSGASIFHQKFEHFLLIYTVNPYYFGTFSRQIWPFLGCSYFSPNLVKIFGGIYFSPNPQNLDRGHLL